MDDWAKTLWDELDYKKDTPMPSGKTNILQVSVFVQLCGNFWGATWTGGNLPIQAPHVSHSQVVTHTRLGVRATHTHTHSHTPTHQPVSEFPVEEFPPNMGFVDKEHRFSNGHPVHFHDCWRFGRSLLWIHSHKHIT